MRPPLPARRALAAGLTVVAAVVAGCAAGPAEPAASPGATDAPAADGEGYAPLTVYLVAAQGEAPKGAEGRTFGCGDLLVPVQTVPSHAPDPLLAALDFLTRDTKGHHAEQALRNAVVTGAPDLVLTGHRREGDTEVVTYSGPVAPRDGCEAQRLQAQLQETARAQTSAGTVRIEVDGTPLDTLLGLPPLALGGVTAASAAPTTSAPPSWTPPASAPATGAEPSRTPSTSAPTSLPPSPSATPTEEAGPQPGPTSADPPPSATPSAPWTSSSAATEASPSRVPGPSSSGATGTAGPTEEPSSSAAPARSTTEEGAEAPARKSATPATATPSDR